MGLIEALLDLQTPREIELSRDTKQLVYSTTLPGGHRKGEHDISTIWIAETGVAKSSRSLSSGLHNDRSAKWSPDGESIAFLSDRADHGRSSAIYLLRFQSNIDDAEALTPVSHERAITDLHWSSDGKYIAFISADETTPEQKAKERDGHDANVWGEDWPYNRLRIVNLASRDMTTLVSINAHITSLSWNDDNTEVAFTSTDNPDIESADVSGTMISIVNVASRAVREVCLFPTVIEQLIWAGDSIYFTGPGDPPIATSATIVNRIALNVARLAYQRYVGGDIECIDSIRQVGQDLAVVIAKGLESHVKSSDGRTLFRRKGHIYAWDIVLNSESDNEVTLAVILDDTNSPPEVFVARPSDHFLIQLSDHGKALSNESFGIPISLSCISRSMHGETPVQLDGIFVTPRNCKSAADGKPEQPLPTVLNIHGGPYGRVTDQFNPSEYMWTPALLAKGYGILTVNYRCGSGRGQDFAAYMRGGVGVYDYADVIEMVQCAIQQGYTDKDNIVVSGWSHGGMLTYLCCTRNGQHGYNWKFKGAIAGAGGTNWDTMTFTSDVGIWKGWLAGGSPWKMHKSDTSDRKGSAIFEFADAVSRHVIPPMLILHSELDERVPVEQAKGFRRALIDAKLPFEYVTYPREPHMLCERGHWMDMMERVLRFVDAHIGPPV